MGDSQKELARDAIKRKLLGYPLSYDEAFALMNQFSTGGLGDIFVAYFAASSFRNGYTDDELYYLTKAMVETGKKLKLNGIVADKHSIGGLPGTRASMIVVPIIVAAGYKIPKTSSRAITSPAGTADCMEVLAPVTFEVDEVRSIVHKVGGCIVWGGKVGMAPADDIIIRVQAPLAFESYDKVLISILAKKVAAGATHVVLDIPVGPTMKMKYVKDALSFRDRFTRIAQRFHVTVKADINFQLQPAGNGIGPSHETRDAAMVLLQDPMRSMDLEWKSLRLASTLLEICFKADNRNDDPLEVAQYILRSGRAMKAFRAIVGAQGGKANFTVDDIPMGSYKKSVLARENGIISSINSFHITSIARILGAPDEKTAGLVLKKRVNDVVKKGDVLCELHGGKPHIAEAYESLEAFPLFAISH